jgi:DNA-binding NarL/FixJ family response regulator
VISGRPVRVLLVDDDPMVRRGLRMVLEGYQQIDLVGEAADGDEVLDRITRHQPAVVLMDLRMHRVDGVRATQLATALPGPPAVVVMTSFDTDREVLAALRAGASGYLLKDADPDEILAAILSAASAGSSLSATVLRQLVTLAARPPRAEATHDQARRRLASLTASERDVAAAVAEGLTNEQIATRLHLAPATVKAYVSRAMTKLHIDGNRVLLALTVLEADR